jgi:hypothetical protein
MTENSIPELPADGAALLDLGFALGQTHTFGLVAGRCSAAQAEGLRRLREQKTYKCCAETWDDFCHGYLKISKREADRTIALLEEFGPAYFDLSQLTRISPETYRAIAPEIHGGALHYQGEAIELNPENSRKVAAAVAEMRSAIPKPTPLSERLTQELNDICHESNLELRIQKLEIHWRAVVEELEKLARDQRLGIARRLLNRSLDRMRDELIRVAAENGGE